jgi:Protein of unknown function (DUF3892)
LNIYANKQYNGYTTEVTHYCWYEHNNPTNKDCDSKQDIIEFLKKEGNKAYTQDSYGNTSECYVKSRNGSEYVTTVADNNPLIETDNLLNLPNCN